jgi:hypothetical protein
MALRKVQVWKVLLEVGLRVLLLEVLFGELVFGGAACIVVACRFALTIGLLEVDLLGIVPAIQGRIRI